MKQLVVAATHTRRHRVASIRFNKDRHNIDSIEFNASDASLVK